MEEENQEDRNVVAALRYFTTGDPECAVCEKRATVVRVTTTLTRKMLITMMCEKCSAEEIDGVLERKEMQPSPDGTHLISPALAAATEEALQKAVDHQREEFERKKKRREKKKKKKAKEAAKKKSKKKSKK